MRAAWHMVILAAGSFALPSCQTQTVKYVDVPEYQLRQGIVPERYVDANGVLVIHRPRRFGNAAASDPGVDAAAASGRIENQDGDVEIRALTPEQVLGQTMRCIIDEDYELLWDQLLSQRTKRQYSTAGQGMEEFSAFMEENRDPIYAALNRMTAGIYSAEVLREDGPHGGMRLRFHPHYGKEFKFDTVDLVFEGFGMKLLMIHPRIRGRGADS